MAGTVGCGNGQNKIETFLQIFHSVKTLNLREENFHFPFFLQPTVPSQYFQMFLLANK
jgi:hypothetical protein